jgi:hypothetical protein
MTVNVSKPAINVREKLAELDKPTGIAGEAMLRAETPQEQFNLVGAGRRNLLINGAMQVAQRGTSFTSTGYTLDRFTYDKASTDEFAATITQSSDSPNGFASSLKVDVTTAESTLATDEYVRIIHKIESQDLQPLAYGTSEARSITLSFWVKSSVTGTYAMSIYMFDGGGDTIGSTYTINSANTWEYKTITFAGNEAAAIANDNTAGFFLNFILLAGSAYTSSDNTTWGTYTGSKLAYGHEANFGFSTSDDFYFTGVQLEVGKVATPFEHRSYGEELAACQRYTYNYLFGGTASNSGTEVYRYYSTVNAYSSRLQFPVTMRAEPTGTVGSTPLIHAPVNNGNVGGSISFQMATEQSVTLQCSPATDYGANQYTIILNTGNVIFDAEL